MDATTTLHKLISTTVTAAAEGRHGAANTVLALAVLLGAGYVILWFFFRRVGGIDPKTGKPGGAEKASLGAWVLAAAILAGVLVAAKS